MTLLRWLLAALSPPSLAFGGGGGSPPPPPPAEVSTPGRSLVPPMLQSPQGASAAEAVRKRAANSRGYGGTIVTGPQGLTAPATTQQNTLKSVLGG